jgi:MarR family transcriptional regulator, 2-MHQ and catechol-resistance regulon repressor
MATHYDGSKDEIRALNAYITLMRAADSVRSVLERRLLSLNLTENQFGTLEMLYHLGPVHQHVLGRKLFTSKGNVTVLVDQLEKRALVKRERDGTDRRLVAVVLTNTGRELVESLLPDHVTVITELFSALEPGEQETLARLCKKLGLNAVEHG